MKVNICGILHDVVETENKFDADLHLGQIDYEKLEIKINKDAKPKLQEETLCHEMVHGILVHLGYNSMADDEQFVQALGNAICQGFNVKKYK